MTDNTRPWRAIAYQPDWTAPRGRRRVVVGRVAAKTQDGLAAWVKRHRDAGHTVDVIHLPPLDGASDD